MKRRYCTTTVVPLLLLLLFLFSEVTFAQQNRSVSNHTELEFPCCTNISDGLEVHPNNDDFTSNAGRILISATQQTIDQYYTSYQTADGQVKIKAYLPLDKQGSVVYFETVDPDLDDLSSYRDSDDGATASDDNPNTGDNLDLGVNAGILSANQVQADQTEMVNNVEKAFAEVTLTITGNYSGDNYQVRASCNENFDTYVETAILVAWKRMYLENDNMYKNGAYLPVGFTGDGNSNNDPVFVNDVSDFSPTDKIVLFDQFHESPELDIISISPGVLEIADLDDNFDEFGGVRIIGKDEVYTVNASLVSLGEAYGASTDGSDGGTFVEFHEQPLPGSEEIPKFSLIPDPDLNDIGFKFANYWFDHKSNSANAFQLVAGVYLWDQNYGVSESGGNISIVAVQEHIPPIPGIPLPLLDDTIIHELGHQFDVDQDHVDEYTNAPIHDGNTQVDQCIMSYNTNAQNMIFEFDFDRNNVQSSCIGDVRTASEPR